MTVFKKNFSILPWHVQPDAKPTVSGNQTGYSMAKPTRNLS